MTRENPALREKLYESIGFTKCDEVEFPPELKSRKITNPDAPRNDHAINLRIRGEEVRAVPILFSTAPKYDVNRGGEFFNYLQMSFLQTPRTPDSQPILAGRLRKSPDSSRKSDAIQITSFTQRKFWPIILPC